MINGGYDKIQLESESPPNIMKGDTPLFRFAFLY
jgi:hypothetical protein